MYERERDRTVASPPESILGWTPLWLLVGIGYGVRIGLGASVGSDEANTLAVDLKPSSWGCPRCVVGEIQGIATVHGRNCGDQAVKITVRLGADGVLSCA